MPSDDWNLLLSQIDDITAALEALVRHRPAARPERLAMALLARYERLMLVFALPADPDARLREAELSPEQARRVKGLIGRLLEEGLRKPCIKVLGPSLLQTGAPRGPVLFFLYVPEDHLQAEELKRRFAPLVGAERVQVRTLSPGQDFKLTLEWHRRFALRLVALVTSRFLASEPHMKQAELASREGRLVFVLVEPCGFDDTFLNNLSPLPPTGEPILSASDPGAAWQGVVTELKRLLPERPQPSP